MAGDLAELRALVARNAPAPGRHVCALPEILFVRSDRPTALARTQAPSLLLCVIVQGKKVSRFAGRELVYDAESYLVVAGELEYESRVIEASPERPYLTMLVALPPEVVVETLMSLGDTRAAAEEADAYVSKLDATLVETLCRLVRTLDDPGERRVVAPLVMGELVFRLLRSEWAAELRRQAAQDGDHVRIARAMTFMRANLGRRLSVASIARHVAMSPSHFAHRFREVARTSPMTYLKHMRLLEARVLLVNEGLRPAEVASRVGYASATHFHRDFKQRFDLPPVAYCKRFFAGSDKSIAGAVIA
ncbi:MAG TPA: AraC family transcriptional regulator [Kofleriaceae bacterium]|nr:AraC family transcriptional regulator [Kofleriaceae bacterium]